MTGIDLRPTDPNVLFENVVDRIIVASGRTKTNRQRNGVTICCPAHDDKTPSLSVSLGDNGDNVVIKCHGTCTYEQVLAAAGLRPRDLYVASQTTWATQTVTTLSKPPSPPATYPYHDQDGELVGEVRRKIENGKKWFRPFRLDGTPKDFGKHLYRLPQLVEAVKAGRHIFIVEGEKDVDRLASLGLAATCNIGGTGRGWQDEYTHHFDGANVVIIPDNDKSGRNHAHDVATALEGHAATIKTVRLDGLPTGGDVSDWLNNGHGRADLEAAVTAEPEWDGEIVSADTNSSSSPPTFIRLDKFLDQPDPDVAFRIESLHPAGGRTLLAAQYKAGKSTMVANLIRTLVDGEPFLGKYHPEPLDGPVVLIDDELHPDTLRRWLRDQGIVNTDQVYVLPLRGRLQQFDIMNDTVRAAWAREIADLDAAFLILDCLRPLIDALGLDENHDTGKVLGAFDELIGQAQVDEASIVHHMGHGGERSRGDSRLRDWPDVEWKIVRASDDAASPRYFSAYGRDVDEPEQRLELDGRHLTIVGGSRKMAEAERGLAEVMRVIGESADRWMPTSDIVDASQVKDPTTRKGIDLAIERGRVEMVEGADLRDRGIDRGEGRAWSPIGKYHRELRLTVVGLGDWATTTGECAGCGAEGPLGTDDQCTSCRMGGTK